MLHQQFSVLEQNCCNVENGVERSVAGIPESSSTTAYV